MWYSRSITLALLIALLKGTSRVTGEDAQTMATQEIMDILTDPEAYDSSIRPSSGDGPTNVKITGFIRDIDINDVTMRAELDITFRMQWNDPRLAYTTPGVDFVVLLKSHLAWLPDAFFKSAKTKQHKSIYDESYLRIFPDGDLIYSSRLTLDQKCPMNMNRFPHDRQTCYMRIASYGYTNADISFALKEPHPIQISRDLFAGKFYLADTLLGHCNSKTTTGEYSCVEIGLEVKRVFGTYLMEWYLPTMFLVIVAWFSFLVPAEQFLARLLLTLVPLISLTSLANTFTQELASVPYTRAVDIFTGVSLTIIFLTLVYVIVCYIKGNEQGAADGMKRDCPEDGEGKAVDDANVSGLRRLMGKARTRAETVTRSLLIGIYGFFVFVYFAAYCGTG